MLCLTKVHVNPNKCYYLYILHWHLKTNILFVNCIKKISHYLIAWAWNRRGKQDFDFSNRFISQMNDIS